MIAYDLLANFKGSIRGNDPPVREKVFYLSPQTHLHSAVYAAYNQADIVTAESEGIGQGVFYLCVSRLMGDIVEITFRIRIVEIDGRMDSLLLNGFEGYIDIVTQTD